MFILTWNKFTILFWWICANHQMTNVAIVKFWAHYTILISEIPNFSYNLYNSKHSVHIRQGYQVILGDFLALIRSNCGLSVSTKNLSRGPVTEKSKWNLLQNLYVLTVLLSPLLFLIILYGLGALVAVSYSKLALSMF